MFGGDKIEGLQWVLQDLREEDMIAVVQQGEEATAFRRTITKLNKHFTLMVNENRARSQF